MFRLHWYCFLFMIRVGWGETLWRHTTHWALCSVELLPPLSMSVGQWTCYLTSEEDYLGIFSIMFWTLTLIGIVKYVCIALSADDDGEGMRNIWSHKCVLNWRYHSKNTCSYASKLQVELLRCTPCSVRKPRSAPLCRAGAEMGIYQCTLRSQVNCKDFSNETGLRKGCSSSLQC